MFDILFLNYIFSSLKYFYYEEFYNIYLLYYIIFKIYFFLKKKMLQNLENNVNFLIIEMFYKKKIYKLKKK